jgi:hypothetical protein
MRRWRLYRSAVIAYNRLRLKAGAPESGEWDRRRHANDDFNQAALSGFVRSDRGGIPVVLFFPPNLVGGFDRDEFLKKMGLPFLDIRPEISAGFDPEFNMIHPPRRVYAWYAKRLAEFLRKEKLLPREGARAR